MNNIIKFGAIKPKGFLKNILEKDIKGCIGNLDKLVPSLITEHDIYGKDRIKLNSTTRDLGIKKNEESDINDLESQYMWWNSETQSNWKDAYCRSQLLLGEDVSEYLNSILKTQDENGYLGIYDKELRYKFTSENGELWAKATLYRVLLGIYEATNNKDLLYKIEKSVKDLMDNYKEPFGGNNTFCGQCHGLSIVDVFNRLYELTNKKEYIEYAVWLYENYSNNNVCEEDIKTDNCYEANERKHPDEQYDQRYKYSPTHQEAAVCCVPNSGRITPYFIKSMFLKVEDGIKVALFGECELKDTINEVDICIKQITNYPFEEKISLEIEVSKPIIFSLYIRCPKWAKGLIINSNKVNLHKNQNEYIIKKEWVQKEVINIEFECDIQFHTDFVGDIYIKRGALLYALPIEHIEKVTKEFDLKPFTEKVYLPLSREYENLSICQSDLSSFKFKRNLNENLWTSVSIDGIFKNGDKKLNKAMIPIGNTILRKVTFKKEK